jgi:hypothetical protein
MARLKKKLEQEKKRQDATMTREEKRFAQIDRELSMAADWFK